MHEPDLARACGVERIRQVHDFGGARRANGFDELAENVVGREIADSRRRHPETRTLRRDPQVALQREHQPAGQRVAMNRRDRRHR